VIDHQLNSGLANVAEAELLGISVACEPVWAIGKAEYHATPQRAAEAHAMLRTRFAKMFGKPAAEAVTIQYGGSVVPADAAAVLSQPGVDGVFIGGASLKAQDSLSILSAAVGCFRSESATISYS
jgi:triosephosphate isomerase